MTVVRHASAALAAAAIVISAGAANAQPFCLRAGCDTAPPTSFFPSVSALSTSMSSTTWVFGYAQETPAPSPGLFLGNSPASPQPLYMRAAGQLVPPRNSLGPGDEVSPIAVDALSSQPISVVTNHRADGVYGAVGAGMARALTGQWSDPSLACTNTECVGVAANNSNQIALFVFDGGVVRESVRSWAPPSGGAVSAPPIRPAVITIQPDRFVLIRPHFTAMNAQVSVHEINTSTMPVTVTTIGMPIRGSVQPGSPIVASSSGGSMIVAWADNAGGVNSVRATAFATIPSIGTPSTPVQILPGMVPFRSLGLARVTGAYVFTWQEESRLFRMPLQIAPDGLGEPGVAFRATNFITDRVLAATQARSHRVASGPKALIVFDELSGSASALAPRAMGYIANTCEGDDECALALGVGWDGVCRLGNCVLRPRDAGADAEAGVEPGMEAGSEASVEPGMEASVEPAMEAGMDASEDSDAAADAVAMDVAQDVSLDADAKTPGVLPQLPQITGGACDCRAGAQGRGDLRAMSVVIGLAVCAVRAARRRRSSVRG